MKHTQHLFLALPLTVHSLNLKCLNQVMMSIENLKQCNSQSTGFLELSNECII